MEPDSRSEDYPPPPFIQPFNCNPVSNQCYEDYAAQPLPPEQPSSSLSTVEADSYVQLSAAALPPPPPPTLRPPTQLLSDTRPTACSTATDDLKRKGTEWLPPTPVDSDNSPSPPGEDKLQLKKHTKCIPPPEGGIVVSLLDADLWNNFKMVGNEMIVTKPGRRLFPTLLVSIRGLEANVDYDIVLRFSSVDTFRYKFMNMKWVPVGESEVLQDERRQAYRHPNSPKPGYFWMKKPISFKPCKISHDPHSKFANIFIHTMHKYLMKIVITPLNGVSPKPVNICLDATEFVAVSAYQNTNLTQLKIDNNPFAKGFRDREIVPATSYPAFHHAMYRSPVLDSSVPLSVLSSMHDLAPDSVVSSAAPSPMFSAPPLPTIPTLSTLPDYSKLPVDYTRLPIMPPHPTDYTRPPFPYPMAHPISSCSSMSNGLPMISGFSINGHSMAGGSSSMTSNGLAMVGGLSMAGSSLANRHSTIENRSSMTESGSSGSLTGHV